MAAPLQRRMPGPLARLVVAAIIVVSSSSFVAEGRQFTKCEFAREMSKYFPEGEIAACEYALGVVCI